MKKSYFVRDWKNGWRLRPRVTLHTDIWAAIENLERAHPQCKLEDSTAAHHVAEAIAHLHHALNILRAAALTYPFSPAAPPAPENAVQRDPCIICDSSTHVLCAHTERELLLAVERHALRNREVKLERELRELRIAVSILESKT